MPIRPEFRHLYGHQWLTVTRPRVLKRAHNECERCRKPLHAWIFTYTWKSRDPQFCGAWRYHMIWIQKGAKVCRNQEGNPCSPLHAPGPSPGKSASSSPSPTPTTTPRIWTTSTSAAGAPGATSITTSPTTKKPAATGRTPRGPFCAMPREITLRARWLHRL
jgi:hypothetical protein